jgi:hypothetical protein
MKITFSCRCGQRLQAREENRGKKVRCPSCSAVVRIPEVDGSDAEIYALAARADGVVSGAVPGGPDHSAATVREPAPRQAHRLTADGSVEGAPDPAEVIGSTRVGEPESPGAPPPYSLEVGSSSWLYPPPPLPGESRSEPLPPASRRVPGGSRIGRLASRTLTIIGWLCIAVAGVQFSVFAGSIAWSFKAGRDLAAHDARVRQVEKQIAALEERIVRRQAPPLAQRRLADDDVDARQNFHQARPVAPRRVAPDEEAREKLEEELLRLRMSKPSEFTLAAAFAMATGFAMLLFWLAGTSGLLACGLGCLLLRLTSH